MNNELILGCLIGLGISALATLFFFSLSSKKSPPGPKPEDLYTAKKNFNYNPTYLYQKIIFSKCGVPYYVLGVGDNGIRVTRS